MCEPVIRLAVIGVAHQHAAYVFDELGHQPAVQLVAVADPDRQLAAHYAERFDVPSYGDGTALLADHEVDVVATAAVFGDRGRVIVNALQAGAHVLADKPLCIHDDELDEIERWASQTGRVVSVMFEKRHYPVTQALHRLITEGTLGELALFASTGPHTLNQPARPPWFFERHTYGGILCDLAVHDVDLVLWLAGLTQGTVTGFSANGSVPEHPGFADHGVLALQSGSVLATIDVHYLTPAAAARHGDYRMRVVGTQGNAEVGFTTDELVVTTNRRAPWHPSLLPRRRPAEDFFTSLAAGQNPEVATAASVAATRVALAAQRSADGGGQPVDWCCQ